MRNTENEIENEINLMLEGKKSRRDF